MSPILVRPVREQLEHDRVIRLLQAKYKRKFDVAINPGNEQTVPVGAGPSPWYPDLVLQSTEKSRKLLGVVEVETAESVNHLEAMSQWATFSRLRVPFHLYIPAGCVDSARRLCTDLQITTTELWAFSFVGDQARWTLVQRAPEPADGQGRSSTEPAAPRPRAAGASRPAASPAKAASVRPAPSRVRTTATASPARRATPAAPAPRATTGKAKAPRRVASKSSRTAGSSRASRATKRR